MKRRIVNALAKGLAELGFRSRVNAVLTRQCAGVSYKIPLTGGLGDENLQLSEPWMTETLRRALPQCSGVFVDVGVNLGQTLIKLKCLEPERNYLGFEPNPACVSYVNRLIAANDYRGARLIPAGLFDANTVLELELYGGEVNSAASLVEGFRPAKTVPANSDSDSVLRAHKQFVPVLKYASSEDSTLRDQLVLLRSMWKEPS
ncbi:MAG: hypothetical protein MPJ50_00680 [Pirellulales bacterium]|nr:hypothetical protein [Pirellulales bacterium]